MGKIRTFIPEDIPQVVDLYQQVQRDSDKSQTREIEIYFKKIFFHNPWYDEKLPSYVYQEENGDIIGFVGVIPRKMIMNGKPVQIVIGNHLVVREDKRNTMAGAQLIRKLFSGPQDLIISEGNKNSLRIWQAAGGVVSSLYSIHWTTVLCPSAYLSSHIGKNKLISPFIFLSKPLLNLIDLIVTKFNKSPFFHNPTQLLKEDLNIEDFLQVMSKFNASRSLKPDYDERSLKWLMELLGKKTKSGKFKKVLLRNEKKIIVGWYLYYLNKGDISKVIQICARKGFVNQVFNQLLYDAWEQGSIAVTGRMEPDFLEAIESKFTLFSRDHSWSLLHSKNPEPLDIILKGDAFFSLLEGEWWIPFRDDEVD